MKLEAGDASCSVEQMCDYRASTTALLSLILLAESISKAQLTDHHLTCRPLIISVPFSTCVITWHT